MENVTFSCPKLQLEICIFSTIKQNSYSIDLNHWTFIAN